MTELHGPSSRLDNMSSRPDTQVRHPSNDPARQLVPAFRAVLEVSPDGRGAHNRLLRTLGIDTRTLAAGQGPARRRLEAIADAVVVLLGLPAVVPLAPVGGLPDTVVRPDPLLALALLARRSGPVWLARRAPGVEGLERGGAITLLLQGPVRTRIVAAVDEPAWPARVLEQAILLEASR